MRKCGADGSSPRHRVERFKDPLALLAAACKGSRSFTLLFPFRSSLLISINMSEAAETGATLSEATSMSSLSLEQTGGRSEEEKAAKKAAKAAEKAAKEAEKAAKVLIRRHICNEL